jgi:DnaJ homolog subfamily B member 12
MAFEGEVSPEELFNMFFGGGMGGNSPFGNGFAAGPGAYTLSSVATSIDNCPGVFTASFGPGGFRTTRMGGGQPRRQQGGEESRSSIFLQLLPLLLLLGFSFLNALPSLFAGPSYPDPHYTFSATSSYNSERSTANLGIKYYVNEAQLNAHPVIGVELSQAPADRSTRLGKGMRQFENAVEQKYTNKVDPQLRSLK